MAESEGLTRDQIREIVEDDDFNVDEMRELLKEELSVDLPQNLTTDQIVEFVYDAYQKRATEVSQVRREKRSAAKSKRASSKERDGGGVSRAAFVTGVIKDAGKEGIDKSAVEQALDEAFGYSASGKSPKTRVNRVLRSLTKKGLIEERGTKIVYTG